jgi:hypothetical protein
MSKTPHDQRCTWKPGDVLTVDGRKVIVSGWPDGVKLCCDHRGRVAVRNMLTNRLSYLDPRDARVKREGEMKLYRVTFDGQPDYIEAYSFGGAVAIWRNHLIATNQPGDFENDVEPESVELLHEQPVLREVPR